METTFLQVKAVTDTLPIGFYANRKIEATLTEDTESSWYNPLDDTINISYKQLTEGIDRIDESQFEMVIRSNHYHEVAHAMLTPKLMRNTDVLNIFEDERIERITTNLFYGIDYDKAFKAICGKPTAPTSPEHAFFNLVRHHIGEKKWLDRVTNLINKWKTLNRLSDWWPTDSYIRDVNTLFEEYTREFERSPDKSAFSPPMDIMGGKGEDGEADSIGTPKDSKDGEAGGKATMGKSGKGDKSEGFSIEEARKLLDTITSQTFDETFYNTATILFENYRRKNSKGSALQGHSGVLNPRLADRPDYRMFERSTSARGNNSFGSFHLNLYIDTSGSFASNDNATNNIIKALTLLEKKHHNFSFDVITTGACEEIRPRNKRYIRSSGGNHLSGEIFDIVRKMQLPQVANYNIVLFDGDAYSNDVNKSSIKKWISKSGQGFRAFAIPNCMIISDRDNAKYISKYAPSTRTIYTDNYVDELSKNIITALQIALN